MELHAASLLKVGDRGIRTPELERGEEPGMPGIGDTDALQRPVGSEYGIVAAAGKSAAAAVLSADRQASHIDG
jgi:hypothetical protein